MWTTIYIFLMVATGIYFFLSTVLNCVTSSHQTRKDSLPPGRRPFVSVLIPARNEEKNIAACVGSLLRQTYGDYEVIVLDDNSTDSTLQIIEGIAKERPDRVRVLKGKPLPEGWRGKSFALKQLSESAKGELLLLTDADTIHSEKSVEMMAANLVLGELDMASGYITQDLRTAGEKTTVPAMYSLTAAIPMYLNDKFKSPIFSAAIGQYIGIKKSSLMAAGGYDAIKNVTTEDIALARRMKKMGFKTAFLDFNEAAKCRMYEGYAQSIKGIAKNIFDFAGRSKPVLFAFAYAVAALLCSPFVSLVCEIFKCLFLYQAPGVYMSALIFTNLAFFASWLVIFKARGLPLNLALCYPSIFFNTLGIILTSCAMESGGKSFVWKGRAVN